MDETPTKGGAAGKDASGYEFDRIELGRWGLYTSFFALDLDLHNLGELASTWRYRGLHVHGAPVG